MEAVDIAALNDELDALSFTRPRLKSNSSYTYVVAAGGHGVKIGHSKRPRGRLSELQVGSPLSMWLAHTWRLSPDGAKALERQLHAAFAWAANQGEWFDVVASEVIPVGDHLLAGRAADAQRLAGLHRERREIEARLHRLRRAWYYTSGKPRERAAAEAAAKLQVPGVEREHAQNELDAYALGYWVHAPLHTVGGRNTLKWLQDKAAKTITTEEKAA